MSRSISHNSRDHTWGILVILDTRFEEKLVDVVGLYLNPPEKAVVLCMDEETQTQ